MIEPATPAVRGEARPETARAAAAVVDTDVMPALVPTKIWPCQSVGETKWGTAPTEIEPSVAPVAGARATSRPLEVFTLQIAPPPTTGGPPAALVCQPGVSEPPAPIWTSRMELVHGT